MKENERKNSPLLIVVGIALMVLGVIGAAYAFYTANIDVIDGGSSIMIKTETLTLVYNANISTDGIIKKPNDSYTSVFTVENTSNVEIISYDILFVNVDNEIINDEYVFELACKAYTNYGSAEKVESGTCSGVSQTPVPTTDGRMHRSSSIPSGITHEYTLLVTFIDNHENQNYNQNKSVTFKLNIE